MMSFYSFALIYSFCYSSETGVTDTGPESKHLGTTSGSLQVGEN